MQLVGYDSYPHKRRLRLNTNRHFNQIHTIIEIDAVESTI